MKTIKVLRSEELDLSLHVLRRSFQRGGWPVDEMSDGDILTVMAVRTGEWLCLQAEEVLERRETATVH